MTITSGILLVVAVLFLILIAWGLFTPRRNVAFGVLGILILPVAVLGAWYSWMETQSPGWTIGYGVLAIIGIANAFRHFGKRGTRSGVDVK